MEPKRNETDLSRLFEPHSVAHVGASAKPAAGRFNFTEYLLNMGFQGKVFPVNPKYEEVSELTCYPSLAAIPGPVDLAILAVPALRCVEVLGETPAEKVRFVVIHTSGFGEMEKGDLEAEILALSRAKGFRVIGPNCMGIYSQPGGIGFLAGSLGDHRPSRLRRVCVPVRGSRHKRHQGRYGLRRPLQQGRLPGKSAGHLDQ